MNSVNIHDILLEKVCVGDIDIAYKVFGKGDLIHHNFLLFAIKTTPAIIITVAIIICGVIDSPSIIHPKITATTGLT